MIYKKEQISTFTELGKPLAFIRFDETTRQRIVYMCHEANDEELEQLFSDNDSDSKSYE